MAPDEDRDFGVDAPSGARWYDFDPRAHVERAFAGTFGGGGPGGRRTTSIGAAPPGRESDLIELDDGLDRRRSTELREHGMRTEPGRKSVELAR